MTYPVLAALAGDELIVFEEGVEALAGGGREKDDGGVVGVSGRRNNPRSFG